MSEYVIPQWLFIDIESNASAVVENATFLCRSLYLPYEVSSPLALHIEIYTASHGFPATARLLYCMQLEDAGQILRRRRVTTLARTTARR